MLSSLNASAAELHELLTQNYGADYALSEAYWSLGSTQDTLTLPADFFKLLSLDISLSPSDGYCKLDRWQLSERDKYGTSAHMPSGIYRLYYIPAYANATALSDSLPSNMALQNWTELIVEDVCAKISLKGQSEDYQSFVTRKADIIGRIRQNSTQRDAGEPYTLAPQQSHWDGERYCAPYWRNERGAGVAYRLSGNTIRLVPTWRSW